MPRLVVAPIASGDLQSILDWSQETFGDAARRRYESLLIQAMLDVAEDPTRTGVVLRSDLRKELRTYRLYFSRIRARSAAGIVKRPRHVLVFRHRTDGAVEIVRILHEHMDFELHLPTDDES